MYRRPPTSPLFPYTTLFRSELVFHVSELLFQLLMLLAAEFLILELFELFAHRLLLFLGQLVVAHLLAEPGHFLFGLEALAELLDRKSTRLNSSHMSISYAVF